MTEGGSAHPFAFSVRLGALVCKLYQVLPDAILEGCSAIPISIPGHTLHLEQEIWFLGFLHQFVLG